jgi:2-oxoglutarate dehydrogenase E2 component (dihydrolipoamide succinyltransferase)
MPKPGEAVTEATLIEIHVVDGGQVAEGAELYTVETDKTDLVIDAPASGTVKWTAKVGGTYDVGELLAVIE